MDIRFRDVTVSYRRGERAALSGVTFRVEAGLTGLLGPNGAGKTSLLRTVVGTLRPTAGSVEVGGHDVATAPGRRAVHRVLGYLPQDLDPYPYLTAAEFLDYVALLKGIDSRTARRVQCEELLAKVGLQDDAHRRLGAFSGGMRRRLGIAQAFLGDPQLIIVDEPTAGLDPEERMRFRSLLARVGSRSTVLLSTHVLTDVAQVCPRVAVLDGGRLVRHAPTASLVQAAAGRTYLVEGDVDPDGPWTVTNASEAAGRMVTRVVADLAPPRATAVEPTLEDGYVALLRDSRRAARGEHEPASATDAS